jgi:hypothetical protein
LFASTSNHHREERHLQAGDDDSLSPTFPLGDTVETFLRREDAERS